MHSVTQQSYIPGLRLSLERWVRKFFAALVLAIILAANLILWPIPLLGFDVDPKTHTITAIVPHSSADRAGLRIGDRVMRLYGRPWTDVIHRVTFVDLIGDRRQRIQIEIARDAHLVSMTMDQDAPSVSLQLYKLAVAGLALVCWLTGYQLSMVRRHSALGSTVVPLYWFGLSGVLGLIPLAHYTALPVLVVLLWLMNVAFAPLTIYIHGWYPPRAPAGARTPKLALYLFALSLIGTLSVVMITYWTQASIITLIQRLSLLLPVALVISLSGSAWVLYHAYQLTAIAHIRRQIRLIGSACLLSALLWFLLWGLPRFTPFRVLIPDYWIIVIGWLVPFAYLIGSLTPDLQRIDRLMRRLVVHIATVTLLATLLTGVMTWLAWQGPLAAMTIAVTFVSLYQPLLLAFQRLTSVRDEAPLHRTLAATMIDLTTSLEAATIATTLTESVRTLFAHPALAFFLGDIHGTNALTLQVQDRLLDVPPQITPGRLAEQLRQSPPRMESRDLQRHLVLGSLTAEEQAVVMQQTIALWCPIKHTAGHLLGLLVVGQRGDRDPYRPEDLHVLDQLLAAAALALINSAAYTEQQEAQTVIRQLYQRLLSAQDGASAALTRELHDEIINAQVRLNIESLRTVLPQIDHPQVKEELTLVLASEQTVIDTLRIICERLHPSGLDDPLGLPTVLRTQVEKAQARWNGACVLEVQGELQPVDPAVQREAVRIAKEAVANAMQHAQASRIVIYLCYPQRPGALMQLRVIDDGVGIQQVQARIGHWGIRFMQESARLAGGSLTFHPASPQGTAVIFSFPPQGVTHAAGKKD